MTSDQQFLHPIARLIIKELVKAAIRKVIELIMEERLIYDEYTGQPTRVHMEDIYGDGINMVGIKGPKEHFGKGGGYSQYSRVIPRTIWDKLAPADPTRTQLADRVKDALQPLGLEVTDMSVLNHYNCTVITAHEVDSRGRHLENRDQYNPEAFLSGMKFDVNGKLETTFVDPEAVRQIVRGERAWSGGGREMAKSIQDRALGKVGDTEMRTGGLVNPVSYVNAPLDKGNHDWKIKGRDFTKDFKKSDTIKTADHLYLITDVHADYMDIKDVFNFSVTRVEGLTYDDKGNAVIGGHIVLPPLSTGPPRQVRQRLASFRGVPIGEVMAFKDVKIDGTDVRDFCFCHGDDDGHELGSPGGCVSRSEELIKEPGIEANAKPFGRTEAKQLVSDIQVGDTVQSQDVNGDGVVIETAGDCHRVKWDISGGKTWWKTDELEVLSRGEDIVIRGGERLFSTFKETAEARGWNVPGESESTSSCSCANPACTWRGSFECKYDTFSHLENRGAIE